jgi:hypothetical protein
MFVAAPSTSNSPPRGASRPYGFYIPLSLYGQAPVLEGFPPAVDSPRLPHARAGRQRPQSGIPHDLKQGIGGFTGRRKKTDDPLRPDTAYGDDEDDFPTLGLN